MAIPSDLNSRNLEAFTEAGTAGTSGIVAIRVVNPDGSDVASPASVSVGTIDMLSAGTITTVSTATGVGTVSGIGVLGTVTGMGVLGSATGIGTIGGIGVLGTLSGAGVIGTVTGMGVVGSVSGVGVVSSLTAGSISVIAGTVQNTMTTGTLNAGTIDMLTAGTITTVGTVTGMGLLGSATGVGTVAGVGVVGTVTGVGLVGTVTGVGLVGTVSGVGIVTSVAGGSIAVTEGTFREDPRTTKDILAYGTIFGGTAAVYGTLVGSAGAGTSIWVNELSIVNQSGTTLTALVGFGTALNGDSVLAFGQYANNGGIQKSFPKAVNAGKTNTDLVCYVGAAGTCAFNVSYFVSAA